MSEITTRNHYIPQTYLKNFLYDDTLFVYKKGEKFFKNQKDSEDDRIFGVMGLEGLKNIGIENNLYSVEIDGVKNDEMENIFNELGEADYSSIIESIDRLPIGSEIPTEIKDKICIFLSCMRIRTPRFKYEVEEMDSVVRKHFMSEDYERKTAKEIVTEYKEISGQEITEEEAEKVRNAIVDKKYGFQYPNGYFLKHALNILERYTEIFMSMKMRIVRSDNKRHFITSDNPVVYFVPKEKVDFYNSYKNLMSQHVELFFPLSRNLAVMMNRREDMKEVVAPIKRDIVDMFNYNFSINSYNFIFAPVKMNDLNKFVKEYIPYPFEFRMS